MFGGYKCNNATTIIEFGMLQLYIHLLQCTGVTICMLLGIKQKAYI